MIEIHYTPTVTETYTATVKDQNGGVMDSETVTWSLKSPVSGVVINPETGVVTITQAEAINGTFTIVATSKKDSTKSVEKTVVIV